MLLPVYAIEFAVIIKIIKASIMEILCLTFLMFLLFNVLSSRIDQCPYSFYSGTTLKKRDPRITLCSLSSTDETNTIRSCSFRTGFDDCNCKKKCEPCRIIKSYCFYILIIHDFDPIAQGQLFHNMKKELSE